MTTAIDELADRHLRPDPHEALDPSKARQGSVLIRVAENWASTKAGQHAAWLLTNLLARQFNVVSSISFDVPPVRLQDGVAAYAARETLLDTLLATVLAIAGPHISAGTSAHGVAPDFELIVGKCEARERVAKRLFLHGDGWRAFVGTALAIDADIPASTVPVGPYLAAAFTAAEVFKEFRGAKPGKTSPIDMLFVSAWSRSTASSWSELQDGPIAPTIHFPHFYFAGGGAVAQAAALTIGSLDNVSGHVTIVDYDPLGVSNDNRYILTQLSDSGSKPIPMANFLRSRGFTAFPFDGRWERYVQRMGRDLQSAEIDLLEREYRYPLILSCVDVNEPRHAIQNLIPELLLAGSTWGLTAKAGIFNLATEGACLKCYNPIRPRNAIIEAKLTELKRLTGKERASEFAGLGIPPDKGEAYLQKAGCGHLSSEDLEKFAAGPPAMSVGFVSVTAGILLAVELLRFVLKGRRALTDEENSVIANFYNPKLRSLTSGPDAACNCAVTRDQWRRKWHH